MPLAGGWSGRRVKHVQYAPVAVLHFPKDKKVRDSVHARLAQRMAEKAQKEHDLGQLYQFAHKKQLELELAFAEGMVVLMYLQSELLCLDPQELEELLRESAEVSAVAPGAGEQAN
jgi:hypothetical protein